MSNVYRHTYVDGEKFFCLADVLRALNYVPSNNIEKATNYVAMRLPDATVRRGKIARPCGRNPAKTMRATMLVVNAEGREQVRRMAIRYRQMSVGMAQRGLQIAA